MSSEFKFRALTSEDWKDIDDNLIYKEGLRLKDTKRDGTYFSKPLDSDTPGCYWHRIVLDVDIPPNSIITVSFITSETEETGSSFDYERIFTKAKDALIQAPPGKYIRLKIDFHCEGEKSPILRQVKLYYERLSYLRYLPAIYQENSESKEFLERFLSIFESSMYDSEEMISNIPMFFDPMAAPPNFYRWLADWLSLDLYDQLEEKTRREYILKAVDFYKKKGTVSGLEDLVSFLTGKKCCIKEYKNNVFRSWGMEHEKEIYSDEQMNRCVEYEGNSEHPCTKFYHETSRTLDTRDQALLESMGKNKYCDKVHYVIDTNDNGTYSPNVIGIFIFLKENEGFVINEKEYVRQLHKIIDSFLPVFVRANIHIVVIPYIERYGINRVIEEYKDSVHSYMDEKFTPVFGSYKDETNWIWIYSFDDMHNDIKVTNNVRYRTHHSGIGNESPL